MGWGCGYIEQIWTDCLVLHPEAEQDPAAVAKKDPPAEATNIRKLSLLPWFVTLIFNDFHVIWFGINISFIFIWNPFESIWWRFPFEIGRVWKDIAEWYAIDMLIIANILLIYPKYS